MGRGVLLKLATNLLTSNSLNSRCLTELVKIMLKLYPNEEVCMQEICSIISEIRKPLIVPMALEDTKKKEDLMEKVVTALGQVLKLITTT